MASPLVAGRVASVVITFALPLVLARLLDPAAFGTYKELFLVAQTVLLAGQFGLTQSLYYFVPREHEGRGAYVVQVFACLGVLGLAAALVLWRATPTLAHRLDNAGLVPLGVPLALLTAGLLVTAPLEGALISEGRMGLGACAYTLSDGARAALLLWGARTHGLVGLAWGAAAWTGLRVAAQVLAVATGTIPVARPRGAALRRQLAYALPLAGSVWLYVAQKQFVQYAVAAHFDAAMFALFSVASFHLPVIDIVYAPIGEVLMVQLGQRRDPASAGTSTVSERLCAWDDAVDKLATLLWPATACAWLFGGTVLPMLFTTKFAGSVPLFMVATCEIPLWVLPVDALLRAAGRTRFLFGWCALRLAVTAVTVLGGMYLAGLAGALAGHVVSEAVSRVVMTQAGCRLLGARLDQALHPALWRVAWATVLAALPALACRWLLPPKEALFVGGTLYLLTYAALRLGLRSRERQEEAPVAAA